MKINLYEEKGRETDFIFNSALYIRSRTYQSFKAQKFKKTDKTIDLLGCSNSFFQKWISHELYGGMILEIYGSLWELDNCYLS